MGSVSSVVGYDGGWVEMVMGRLVVVAGSAGDGRIGGGRIGGGADLYSNLFLFLFLFFCFGGCDLMVDSRQLWVDFGDCGFFFFFG